MANHGKIIIANYDVEKSWAADGSEIQRIVKESKSSFVTNILICL